MEQRQAKGFSFPVRGPEAGRAASPVESMPPLQDSASQASLTPFSATGTGRSDPGRLIDVTSDQASRRLKLEMIDAVALIQLHLQRAAALLIATRIT